MKIITNKAIPVTSEDMKAAAARFRHIEELDPERAEAVRMVMALCEFARLAYESASGYAPKPLDRTEEEWNKARKMAAGGHAGQYLSVWREMEMSQGGYLETLKVVQRVSDWLRQRGLNGIPGFVTESLSACKVIFKSATQMHHDMLELRRFAAETRAEMATRRAA